MFRKIITNRLESKVDAYQPYEQAGFRKGMNTSEPLDTVRVLNENSTEFNIPIWAAFIDFRKALDTVEFWVIIRSMKNARIDQRYFNIIQTLNENSKITIRLYKDAEEDRATLCHLNYSP